MADNPGFEGGDEGDTVAKNDTNSIRPLSYTPATPTAEKVKQTENGDVGDASNPRWRQVKGGTDITVEQQETDSKQQQGSSTGLLFTVDQHPVWYWCILFGFQQYLIMAISTITVPFLLIPFLCIADDDPVRGQIVCTIIFVSGIITLLQTTLGVRLPIIQGGTIAFLVPTIAFLNTAYPPCSEIPLANMTYEARQEVWLERMRAVQGCIAVTCVFQIIIGFSGMIGLLLNLVTPVTIVPNIVLLGLSLFDVVFGMAGEHWPISCTTIVLMVVFSQYMQNVPVPFPAYSKTKGWHFVWIQVFKIFSLLLAIMLSWTICWILTITDMLPKDSSARTDLSSDLLYLSPYISIPYPGQWGMPTVSLAGVLGMVSGMLASMLESLGDYYACARITGAPPPPTHAVNRGIGMEGVGGLLAGLWGTGNGTTSYSINIGAIGITKVGSLRVIQTAALFMILFGMLGKFGAVFASVPGPVIGGIFCVLFGTVMAVGLSSLQFIDLNSTRNLFILGFAIFLGLGVPKWMEKHPGVIDTGMVVLDQLLTVLLKTSMVVGGFLACFLDNTIPGTAEERGLLKWRSHHVSSDTSDADDDGKVKESCYDLPFGMDALRRASWTRRIPFSPTFRGFSKK